MPNPKEAREQAADYLGFAASAIITLKDGTPVEIPNPGLLDDEQQEAWEALQFELEQCDREPDIEIPERRIQSKDGSETVIAAHTVKGELLQPLRKDGVLMRPSYNVRLAQAILGEAGYKAFKAGGGQASDVALIWRKMQAEWDKRRQADSKSS